VVVIDDSAVSRGMWTRALERSPGIRILTSFSRARAFLDWLATSPSNQPDVVLLDIEMPEMDGIEALPKILELRPRAKVIIASAHSPAGSRNAVQALMLGAVDFISKPSSLSPGGQLEQVAKELVAKVIQYRPRPDPEKQSVMVVRSPTAATPTPRSQPPSGASPAGGVLLVGCSTGGPQALQKFFSLLPKPVPVPVLIVQHMPPKFTTLLAASIRETTGHECREAKDGDVLQAGQVLLAPGDYHMELKRSDGGLKVSLNQNPAENWCRPAVDPLFRSAAETLGSRVFAVVLTGMGEDGRRGAQVISDKGGAIYVQDEASSVVWGMPGAVARAGLAREVLPIPELVSRATRWLLAAGTNSQLVHGPASEK